MDPSKVKDVLSWKTPQNIWDIRSFLGLAGYIVDNPLFVVLFYLFCFIACFWPVNHQVESELLENFQEQARFKGKCP
jgi:hypothetical protein